MTRSEIAKEAGLGLSCVTNIIRRRGLDVPRKKKPPSPKTIALIPQVKAGIEDKKSYAAIALELGTSLQIVSNIARRYCGAPAKPKKSPYAPGGAWADRSQA
jgi:DNA invertase Pin-like site-specific DNA recombinase